jgi:uncharacterized membrane protein YjjB (DUF3815 family)
MKKSLIIASLALCASLGAMAQTTQKLTATKASEYGIIYSLPTTVIDVTIETEKVVEKPGEFYRYAKKYFNTNNAIDNESQSVRLKSITLTPRGVANSQQRYLMQFKSGSTPCLIINDENIPLAINTDEIPELVQPNLPKAQATLPSALETKAAQQVISKEMAQSQSSAKRAEIAANQLFELRQTRQDILNGEAEQMPADGEAMQITLNNIQAQEDALIAMFIGAIICFVDIYSPAKLNTMAKTVISSFLATVIAGLSVRIGINSNPDFIIIGSIMILVPGLAFGTALRDLLCGDLLAGSLKTLQACLGALMIAFGYMLGSAVLGGAV